MGWKGKMTIASIGGKGQMNINNIVYYRLDAVDINGNIIEGYSLVYLMISSLDFAKELSEL